MDEKLDLLEQRKQLEQRTKEVNTLVRVAQLINIIDLDYVLIQTMQLMTEVSGATKGSFFLIDENLQPIQRFLTQRDLPPEVTRQVARDVIEKGLAGWCIRHRRGAYVDDVSKDERWHVFPDDPQSDVQSALCVPVVYEDVLHGVITLVSSERAHFTEANLRLVEAVANHAGTAIRNAQLFDDLQAKQKQLELVLQNNSAALVTVDTDFTITLINHEAIHLMGSEENGVVGKRLDAAAPNSIYPEVIKRIQSVPREARSQSFELRDEKQDRDFVVHVSSLLDDRDVMMHGYVITIHDITSVKEYDRLKTHMLHMLSHDLKNPINVVWGYVDLLRIDSEQGLPADTRFVDGVLRALHRMEMLIDETVSTERLMSEGELRPYERFSPNGIIREAIDGLRQLIANKQLIVHEDIQNGLGEINGIPFQLREAMVNLLSNAIKYTPDNGTISVHASSDHERFTFYVKDTGMGIPKELQTRLFTKFYRANRPAMEDIKGTGLGLSLVKSAIESHRGQVWFESEANVGSTFGFWLPLAYRE